MSLQMNASRKVVGVLRGYDPFMNLVMDDAFEEIKAGERTPLGMVVIRGNSVVSMEVLERI